MKQDGAVVAEQRERLYKIGEAADRLGISTRTLRYYEEVGLVDPVGHTPGGARTYSQAQIERVAHIRELQQVFDFDLDRIREVLAAEDRLAELRHEDRRDVSVRRQEAIVHECLRLNERLQGRVSEKIGMLEGVMAELKATRTRYVELAEERGIRLPTSKPALTPSKLRR